MGEIMGHDEESDLRDLRDRLIEAATSAEYAKASLRAMLFTRSLKDCVELMYDREKGYKKIIAALLRALGPHPYDKKMQYMLPHGFLAVVSPDIEIEEEYRGGTGYLKITARRL